jgi:hypothetical protein
MPPGAHHRFLMVRQHAVLDGQTVIVAGSGHVLAWECSRSAAQAVLADRMSGAVLR